MYCIALKYKQSTHASFQVWDVTASKKVNTLDGHTARVGALAWNGDSLSSGSRDRMILQRDVRTPALMPERRLVGHRQEVCGLKWSPDNQWLASGGNDNKLFVWSSQGSGSANPPGTTTPAGHMSPGLITKAFLICFSTMQKTWGATGEWGVVGRPKLREISLPQFLSTIL